MREDMVRVGMGTADLRSGAMVNAQAIGERLEQLRVQGRGELTPLDVVQDARLKTSPLHSLFQWNDGVAEKQFRLQQARGVIRCVTGL